jgi:hypothetical protein
LNRERSLVVVGDDDLVEVFPPAAEDDITVLVNVEKNGTIVGTVHKDRIKKLPSSITATLLSRYGLKH